MRVKQVTVLLAATLMAGGLSSGVQAAWVAPTGGWQIDYEAAGNKLPSDSTLSPTWIRHGYQTTNSASSDYTGIVTDAVTGESTLFMGNNSGGSYEQKSAGYGAGASSDKITLDFRFRLVDGSKADTQDQLTMNVTRPRSDGQAGRALFFINFAKGHIMYYDAGAKTTYDTDIGLGWHDARWLIDVENNTSTLYLDGDTTPIISFDGWLSATVTNNVLFGDNSSGVDGQAELSYLRMTNNDLAAVPEPASLGLLAGGMAMIALKRRRSGRRDD